MANLKEIVTKAVIGKTKKASKDNLEVSLDTNINNVLGCWVINHNFSGFNNGGKVDINGSYDINIWYSYDNNTKTNVYVQNFTYNDTVKVNLKQDEVLSDNNEIIVRSLTNPSVSDVKVEKGTIKLVVEKELGVEIVGDIKVRVNAVDDYDDYDEEIDAKDIKMDINEDYLNGVNQN
jgi:spore coat protein E